MNSLPSGATLFGSANTLAVADERNKKRSIVIMIILMEILASISNGRDTNSYFKHCLCDIYTLPKGQQRPIIFFFLYQLKSSQYAWSVTTFSANYFTTLIFLGQNLGTIP